MKSSPKPRGSSVTTLPEISKRKESKAHESPGIAASPVHSTHRKSSVSGDHSGWTAIDTPKKSGVIEVKTSPWQLITPSENNQCHFIVCSPTEMFDLPDVLRQEILHLHGTKSGFVILADSGKNFDRKRRASVMVKSFVFIPYNAHAYETFPLEAEQEIKKYFDPPKYNLSLSAIIRLKTGSFKTTHNGVVSMVGSFQRLKNEIARIHPAKHNTALHVVILPLTVRLYDIVDYVTESMTQKSIDTSAHLMKVGPQLINFSELYTTTNTELTHVLLSINMHIDPQAAEGQYYLVDFPGATGSRYLGETTSDCVSRKLYDETGIFYRIQDEDGIMNMLSIDRTMLTMVEELEGDQPLPISPVSSMKSATTNSSVNSLPGLTNAAPANFSPPKNKMKLNILSRDWQEDSEIVEYLSEQLAHQHEHELAQGAISMEEYAELCSRASSGLDEVDIWD